MQLTLLGGAKPSTADLSEAMPLPQLRDYQRAAVNAVVRELATHRGTLVHLSTGLGKAAPLSSMVLTPRGFVTMGSLRVGDMAIGSDGRPTTVTGVFPRGRLATYDVKFSDGAAARVSGDHLWAVRTKAQKSSGCGYIVKSTDDLSTDLRDGSGARKWFAPVVAPVEFAHVDLPLPPYLVGALIGDGCMRADLMISSPDQYVLDRVSRESGCVVKRRSPNDDKRWCDHSIVQGAGRPGRISMALKSLGLWGKLSIDKRIPAIYMTASATDRLDLLRGLMDTDGYCQAGGSAEFYTSSPGLASDVESLIRSLGGATKQRWRKTTHNDACRMLVNTPDNPFALPRKASRYSTNARGSRCRSIDSITPAGLDECQCISVDAPDSLYVMDDYVVTHNTQIGAELVRIASGRVCFIAHRTELIEQAAKRIEQFIGYRPEIEKAQSRAWSDSERPVVASIQTLARESRIRRFDEDSFSLLIIDEVHHAVSSTYRAVIDHFSGAKIVGLTATPDRADGYALGQILDSVAYRYDLPDAIADGWLSPIKMRTVKIGSIDFRDVKITAGDFNRGQLDALMASEEALHGVAKPVVELAGDRPTIVFTTSIDNARRMAEIIDRYAGRRAAVSVDSKVSAVDRAESFRLYESGERQFLVNVGIACLDSETEILTSSGWVGHDSITYDHEVANWDDGKIFFEQPLGIEVRDRRADERMVVLETRNRSIRVTEDHRMVFKTRSSGYEVETAGELVGRPAFLPVSGVADPVTIAPTEPQKSSRSRSRRISQNAYMLRKSGMSHDESIAIATERADHRDSLRYLRPGELTERQCELIGFWLGDGSVSKLSSGGVEYKLRQGDNDKPICAWVDDLLNELDIDYARRRIRIGECFGKRVDSWSTTWSLPRGTGFGPQQRNGIYSIEPYLDKHGSHLFWGLSINQFAALMRGLWMADGDHGQAREPINDRWRVGSCYVDLLTLLQSIAVCRGYRASLLPASGGGGTNITQMYRLSVSKRETHSMTKHTLQFEPGWHPERVWCVKSRSGLIVTRRRGTVTVTGNTEGYDHPPTSCIAMGRPTKSRALYTQMLGRGTRGGLRAPIDGKSDCLVLDFVGVSTRHDMVSAVDALSGEINEDEAALIKEEIEKSEREISIEEATKKANERRAEREQREEEERARRDAIKARVAYKAFDPNPYVALGVPRDYLHERYGQDAATPRQLETLRHMAGRYANDLPANLGKKEAARLMGALQDRRRKGLCTFAQMQTLQKYGVDAKRLSFAGASRVLDALAKNRWKPLSPEVVAKLTGER